MYRRKKVRRKSIHLSTTQNLTREKSDAGKITVSADAFTLFESEKLSLINLSDSDSEPDAEKRPESLEIQSGNDSKGRRHRSKSVGPIIIERKNGTNKIPMKVNQQNSKNNTTKMTVCAEKFNSFEKQKLDNSDPDVDSEKIGHRIKVGEPRDNTTAAAAAAAVTTSVKSNSTGRNQFSHVSNIKVFVSPVKQKIDASVFTKISNSISASDKKTNEDVILLTDDSFSDTLPNRTKNKSTVVGKQQMNNVTAKSSPDDSKHKILFVKNANGQSIPLRIVKAPIVLSNSDKKQLLVMKDNLLSSSQQATILKSIAQKPVVVSDQQQQQQSAVEISPQVDVKKSALKIYPSSVLRSKLVTSGSGGGGSSDSVNAPGKILLPKGKIVKQSAVNLTTDNTGEQIVKLAINNKIVKVPISKFTRTVTSQLEGGDTDKKNKNNKPHAVKSPVIIQPEGSSSNSSSAFYPLQRPRNSLTDGATKESPSLVTNKYFKTPRSTSRPYIKIAPKKDVQEPVVPSTSTDSLNNYQGEYQKTVVELLKEPAATSNYQEHYEKTISDKLMNTKIVPKPKRNRSDVILDIEDELKEIFNSVNSVPFRTERKYQSFKKVTAADSAEVPTLHIPNEEDAACSSTTVSLLSSGTITRDKTNVVGKDMCSTVDSYTQTSVKCLKEIACQTEVYMPSAPAAEEPNIDELLGYIWETPKYNSGMEEIKKSDLIDFSKMIKTTATTTTTVTQTAGPVAVNAKSKSPKEMLFLDLRNCANVDFLGNMPIHNAVLENDLPYLKRQCFALRLRQISIDVQDTVGQSALQLAIVHNKNQECVSILLGNGANVSVRDNESNTLLHLAVMNSTKQVLELVLKYTVKINELIDLKNDDGFTALMIAAIENKLDMAEILLAHGANPNCRDEKSGRTALFHAVELNKSLMINLLLKNKADPKVRNYFGLTALDAAKDIDMPDNNLIENEDNSNSSDHTVQTKSSKRRWQEEKTSALRTETKKLRIPMVTKLEKIEFNNSSPFFTTKDAKSIDFNMKRNRYATKLHPVSQN